MITLHWHIIGAGAIGSWCAYALAEKGYASTLVFRDTASAKSFNRAGGLRVEFNGTTTAVDVSTSSWESLEAGSITHAIIATKSWQNKAALESLLPKLATDATVVLMQNGYGQLQAAKTMLEAYAYFAASTTNGGYKKDRNTLCLAGVGTTHIGAYNAKAINTAIDLPIASSHDDIESVLWRKLCINAAINPLTAIHNVRNGELINHPRARDSISSISEELSTISQAKGQTQLKANKIESWVLDVCRITENNSSSMREDILNSRKTEINEINGYLMGLAQQLDIAAPEINCCWRAIKTLEES